MAKKIPKTMPIRALEESGVPYEALQQEKRRFTAQGVAEDLEVPVTQVLKAMLLERAETERGSRQAYLMILLPGDRRLSLKKAAEFFEDKDIALASERDVERITGFQVGAVSVLGLRRDDVPVFVDQSILNMEQVIISGGRPDVGIRIHPHDLMHAIGNPGIGDYCEETGDGP